MPTARVFRYGASESVPEPPPEVLDRLLVVDDTYYLVLIDPATKDVYRTLDGHWTRELWQE